METLLITKVTIKSYLRCISLKKLFSQKTQNTMYNYQGYPSTRIFLLFSHDVFTLGKSFSLTQQFGETGFQKKKRKSLPASRFAVTGITKNRPKRHRSIARSERVDRPFDPPRLDGKRKTYLEISNGVCSKSREQMELPQELCPRFQLNPEHSRADLGVGRRGPGHPFF